MYNEKSNTKICNEFFEAVFELFREHYEILNN